VTFPQSHIAGAIGIAEERKATASADCFASWRKWGAAGAGSGSARHGASGGRRESPAPAGVGECGITGAPAGKRRGQTRLGRAGAPDVTPPRPIPHDFATRGG